MLVIEIVFYLNAFIIVWAMIGYPISLKMLRMLTKNKKTKKDYNNIPTVTVIVAAHNEEKVIKEKLDNLEKLDYPANKLKILVASDNSTDDTNRIVECYGKGVCKFPVELFIVKKRQGKTNAQNEAYRVVDTEFLVLTDANSMFKKDAVRELMASFVSEDIAYVCGRLTISNSDDSVSSNLESIYWERDLKHREIESKLQTITAGNGAIYACRRKDYYEINPVYCHDASWPLHYGLQERRAIYNSDAIAYEKAGETLEDEYARKVRMNRGILSGILPDIRILNVFKYKWFSYFYFGHRTCRYLLWIAHMLVFVLSLLLINESWIYTLCLVGQVLFYICAFIGKFRFGRKKPFSLCYYYVMTILAQWNGVINIITGNVKPFWEKAESTR